MVLNMPKIVFHTTKICKKKCIAHRIHRYIVITVLLASCPTSLTATNYLECTSLRLKTFESAKL